LKGIKPPNSDWTLRKISPNELTAGIAEELQIEVKGKEKSVNVGMRIGIDLPISAKLFLDQVRNKIAATDDYQGAEITFVQSQAVDGVTWAFFTIKRKDEVQQEFWARSITSDHILMVLYTALGSYYQQYRDDFQKVLKQASF